MPMRMLIVDDDRVTRSVITTVLARDGHAVATADSGEEALELFSQAPFPLVITDIIMGGMSGLDLLQQLKLIDQHVLVIVMTSSASLESATTALRSGAYDYLAKPFENFGIISSAVNRAVQTIRLNEENRRLMTDLLIRTQELETLNSSLQEMANKDGLTGLFNHRFFRETLATELARSTRHGHTFSLILADIDHFKHYNDTFGHLAGDEALRSVARLLCIGRRRPTTVARYGGEEFVLLLPEIGKEGARIVAERLLAEVGKARFPGAGPGRTEKLSLSMGISTFPDDGADSSQLIEQADRALYTAKANGRNRIALAGHPVPTR